MHFISGLPRSGSTLLAALLKQNPRFHANMSSPLAGLAGSLLDGMSAQNEFSVFISDAQRERMLRALFTEYHKDALRNGLVFDTNRAWCSRLPLLRTLFPCAKVIACVRNLSWIVDSLERLAQRNVLSPSAIFNFQSSGTVYSRADMIAHGEGMLGSPYNGLKQAFYGEHAKHLLLVRYESLVSQPREVLAGIYAFLEEAPFAHDVDQIHFDASEFDQRTGTPGLHAVRTHISAPPRPTILPPDVFNRFANDAFWQNPQLNPQGVTVL
jgi:sulfotransferase